MAYVRLHKLDEIKKKLGINTKGRVQWAFQDACYRYMDKYVPLRDNILRKEVDLSDPAKIVYNMKYAEYQYYGQRKDGTHVVRHYTTDGTGKEWDKLMMRYDGKSLVREIEKTIKRG